MSSGLFFVVLAVSGCLLGFQEKIDRALHLRLYEVTPGSHFLPLPDILDALRKAFPTDDIVAVTMPISRRDSWSVALPSGIAFIDPYTGKVLGLRERGTTFVGVISQIHISLACGRIGRTAVRWIDFAALVLLLSGIQLWWPLRRIWIPRRPFTSRYGQLGRRFWLDVHNSSGSLSFVFLIILVGTGAVLSCEGSVVSLIDRLSRHDASPPLVLVHPSVHMSYIAPDRALAIARAALPGTTPTRMQMPAYGGAYKVEMTRVARFGSDTSDEITLDPYSGKVLADHSPLNAPLAERVLSTTAALHTGSLFGFPGRVLMALASLLVTLQAWSGAMMLWKRRIGFEGIAR
jgi:uncharacterized iron-regulated membrane protein